MHEIWWSARRNLFSFSAITEARNCTWNLYELSFPTFWVNEQVSTAWKGLLNHFPLSLALCGRGRVSDANFWSRLASESKSRDGSMMMSIPKNFAATNLPFFKSNQHSNRAIQSIAQPASTSSAASRIFHLPPLRLPLHYQLRVVFWHRQRNFSMNFPP